MIDLAANLPENPMNLLEWNDVTQAKYLETNPLLRDEIQGLSAKDQQDQIKWAFEDEAEAQGIEPWELAAQLIAETPEELKAMRLDTHRQVAEALGMDWAEYCELNDIQE
jgi:hypothetical protein